MSQPILVKDHASQERGNRQTNTPWNIVVIVADTLRRDHLGAYGNQWIQTPNLNRFASESVTFTNAYPECLPTIPTRRTLHTGRRAFPFRNYRPIPWDNVYIPGWQPMSSEETTIAETLVLQEYHTGFFADVPHYFIPGMNFTRGFRQWAYVRGQAEDRYGATNHADEELLARYRGNKDLIKAHLVNVQPQQPEGTWPTARTFKSAIAFVEQNYNRTPFHLYVDSFTPHETWEAPIHYYDLYGSRDVREPICLVAPYGPISKNPEIEERLTSIKANYAGLVTLVDAWFGQLINTIDRLGLKENTLVVFLSDYGTNFGENADRITGKPANYMYPGTMNIPMLIRHPLAKGAGLVSHELVYTLDIPATVIAAAGITSKGKIEGQSLLPIVEDRSGFESRDYLTCRYGNSVWYRDAQNWYFSQVDFQSPRLFDLETDPMCQHDIAESANEHIDKAQEYILADASGDLPFYTNTRTTDALGRPEFIET